MVLYIFATQNSLHNHGAICMTTVLYSICNHSAILVTAVLYRGSYSTVVGRRQLVMRRPTLKLRQQGLLSGEETT